MGGWKKNTCSRCSSLLFSRRRLSVTPTQCKDCLETNAKVNKYMKQTCVLLRKPLGNDFGAHT